VLLVLVACTCTIEKALHVELISKELLPVIFVIAPFQLQSTTSRVFVVQVPSFVVHNDRFGLLCPQHPLKMPSQMRKRRHVLGRNQDVWTVRLKFLGFDFTDAASWTYRHIPEAVEINSNRREATSFRRGSIDTVFGAFTPCIW
jgi:hypothetical protein